MQWPACNPQPETDLKCSGQDDLLSNKRGFSKIRWNAICKTDSLIRPRAILLYIEQKQFAAFLQIATLILGWSMYQQ